VDTVLGPEMKSTGEVMGLDRDFRRAYLKAQIAAGSALPTTGKVFISVPGLERRPAVALAWWLHDLGFVVVARGATARALERDGLAVESVADGPEGDRALLEALADRKITLVVDVPGDGRGRGRSAPIRRAALDHGIPYYTTLDGVRAALAAIEARLTGPLEVVTLQELHRRAA
ncbi:MAG TPA: carbamoyl phosphate synthase large subunit, partial [Candidatus Binatia bacterium]|nr:carbamoyl phosphate synthase large subunit [Candidatus Binatia bacterium]